MKCFVIETGGFYAMNVYVVVSISLNEALELCGIHKETNNALLKKYKSHLELPTIEDKEKILREFSYSE